MLNNRRFPAKLLLFGEHVLLLGAPALAVPVTAFAGQWNYSEERDRHHTRLVELANSEALLSLDGLHTKQFVQDLNAGLYFQSDIPTGYGLGSSGALCAAIYERYAAQKTDDLAALKLIFAQMESFFHGNSSGIDPLTSYVGEPILIQHKTEVQRTSAQAWNTNKPVVFLIDSHLPRRTGPLVAWFLEQSRAAMFSDQLLSEYLPAHEATLQGWLSANAELFWPNLRKISAFQFKHFIPMIPQTLQELWVKSFDNQAFVLKICGAGGGGFIMGFAHDLETVQALGKEFRVVLP